MSRRSFVFAALLFAAGSVVAGGLDEFLAFNSATRSASARFDQQVIDRSGKAVDKSSGTFAFARPGQFRWSYEKPNKQLLVSDGARLWIHDPDLKQVSIKRIDKAVSATPAALLAGKDDITKVFTLRDAGLADGLAWVEATPRDKDTGFEQVRIGMKSGALAAMELHDSLGGRTLLLFHDLKANPKLDPGSFRFSPPPGTDVIEDK